MKSQDGSETWEYGLMDLTESMTTSLLCGPSSSMNLKPSSKTPTSNSKEELPSKSVVCNGPILPNTLPTLRNLPDKQDIPKKMLKPLTYSSKDSLPESSLMSSNPSMLWDIMQLNRRPLKPPKPSYSLMQLSQLKDPKLLQAAIEAEEMSLHMHHHLLKEMHHIALSSVRTIEAVAAATTEETTGTTISNKEDSSSNNSNNTTPPMPCIG